MLATVMHHACIHESAGGRGAAAMGSAPNESEAEAGGGAAVEAAVGVRLYCRICDGICASLHLCCLLVRLPLACMSG